MPLQLQKFPSFSWSWLLMVKFSLRDICTTLSLDYKGSGLQGFWLQGVKVLPKIRVWICSKGLRTSKQGLTLPNLTHSSTWNVSRSIDLPSIAWSKLKSAMHNCFHYFDRRNFNLKVCSHHNYVHYTFTTYMIAFALASHTQLFMCMG